jgi:hypothetical protein
MFPGGEIYDVSKFLYDVAHYKKGDKAKIVADLVALGIDGAAAFADEIIDAGKMAKKVAAKKAANAIKFRKIVSQAADEVNDSLKALGYTHAPYKPGTIVDTIELTEKSKLVRVYDGVNSQQSGGWIMRAEDIAGLTPRQIQNKFALPTIPKYVTDVILEAGSKLRTGVANGLFGFAGGGIQFDLMGQYIGELLIQDYYDK